MEGDWRLRLEAVLVHRKACRRVDASSIGAIAEAVAAEHVGSGNDRSADEVVRAHAMAVHGRFGRSDAKCLPRAFGLTLLLRRHGHPAELVIGVRAERPARGVEEGHAWVEIDGRPIAEPAGKTDAYLEFLRAPKPTATPEDAS